MQQGPWQMDGAPTCGSVADSLGAWSKVASETFGDCLHVCISAQVDVHTGTRTKKHP